MHGAAGHPPNSGPESSAWWQRKSGIRRGLRRGSRQWTQHWGGPGGWEWPPVKGLLDFRRPRSGVPRLLQIPPIAQL